MAEKMTEGVVRTASLKIPFPHGRETVWVGAEITDKAHEDETTEAHRLRVNVECLEQLTQLKTATDRYLGVITK